MKKLVILILAIFTAKLMANIHHNSAVTRALSDVISELFLKRKLSFEILIFGDLSTQSQKVLDGILKTLPVDQTRMVKHFQNAENSPEIEIGNTALIFLETSSFPNPRKFTLINSPKAFFGYILYIEDPNFNLSSIAVNPNAMEGTLDQFSYFLVNDRKKMTLKTFEWWTEDACNQLQLVTLNSFDIKTEQWKNNLNIQEKFFNFHDCTLKTVSSVFCFNMVEVVRKSFIFDLPPIFPSAYHKVEKYELEIMKILGELGNFSFDRPKLEISGEEFLRVSARVDKKVIGHWLDFYFFLSAMTFREDDWQCSNPFYDSKLSAIYSPANPYSNYEKMVLPFDYDTWMYLLITFVVAFLSIFVMNFLPSKIKDIVYGSNVTMPTFNMIGTFFGIGQTQLPGNNFARIILMSFILFCLIFRTVYQGVFFEMMTSDMRRSPPFEFRDLMIRNYTLILPDSAFLVKMYESWVDESERPFSKTLSFMDTVDYYERMSDPSLKTAIILGDDDYHVLKAYRTNTPHLMKQQILVEPLGVCTRRNNFAFRLMDSTATCLIQSGILQHFYYYLLNFEMRPLPDEESGPNILSISDLEFGFVVWLFACGFSIFVFFMELLWCFVRYHIKQFLGLFYFLKVLNRILNQIN